MVDLVSVIMPCYNDGKYIEESIASVRSQTYPAIELIVVDDGSEDEHTIQIMRKLESDSHCTVLHSDHKGPSSARNTGIAHAHGKYILPLDSDDKIDKTYIEKAVRAIEEKPERGVVYCFAEYFGEERGPWKLEPYSLRAMIRDNIVFITALFYREDWEHVGGFNTELKFGMEDYDFWISLLEIGREIYQIPETLFYYRIKKKSRTTMLLEDIDNIKSMYHLIYNNHPAFYEQYKDLYAIELRDAFIEVVFLNNRLRKSVEIYKKLKKIPGVHAVVKKILKSGISG